MSDTPTFEVTTIGGSSYTYAQPREGSAEEWVIAGQLMNGDLVAEGAPKFPAPKDDESRAAALAWLRNLGKAKRATRKPAAVDVEED